MIPKSQQRFSEQISVTFDEKKAAYYRDPVTKLTSVQTNELVLDHLAKSTGGNNGCRFSVLSMMNRNLLERADEQMSVQSDRLQWCS